MILGGCSQPTPIPSTAAAPLSAKASIKPITLKFAEYSPPTEERADAGARWAKLIEERSGGRLKVEIYYSETLAKLADVYKATQTDVADIGYVTIGTNEPRTPLSIVTRLPFIGIPSISAGGSIWMDLYNKFPEIRNEWPNLKPLVVSALLPDNFYFTKKVVHMPDDIKGMKLIARGVWPNLVAGLGTASADIAPSEWYTSLERGLVEGHLGIQIQAIYSMKLFELYKYSTIFGESGCSRTGIMYMMNQQKFNSLPADLQIILEETSKWFKEELVRVCTATEVPGVEMAKYAKHTFTYATPEETKLWVEAADKYINDKWIEDNASRGPSKAIYEETLRLVKQYIEQKN
jgi:TRAP-type C4-dicarboxylate transport system substrate-binding protein